MEHKGKKRRLLLTLTGFIGIVVLAIPGCVATGGSATKHHQDTLSEVTEHEYHIPKRPIDRHYIGASWSKQFGPVEDPNAAEIRVKKEHSFNSIQQDFAFKTGIGLGGQLMAGPKGEIGAEGGSVDKAKLEGVEIITPVSLADIPFEPKVTYVTEALRLKNFRLKSDKVSRAGINVSANVGVATASAKAEVGSRGKTGTEGEGLVVAYKLHMIDRNTYERKESEMKSLPLNIATEFSEAKVIVKARLMTIEPGSNESLPRSILWACDYAEAKSRDIIAAWVVDIKSLDPKRKSLSVGFPGYPAFDDCQNFSGVIYSAIDPLTDKITREKITISVIDAKLSDTLTPVEWDARIAIVDESFNIKLVPPPRPVEPQQE
ncbi:MAG: hypothetical protein JXB42_10590 [Deltaproteobacteria bacterium]|nr:hypothetical protein [Deltaproteobacteria bacterium]